MNLKNIVLFGQKMAKTHNKNEICVLIQGVKIWNNLIKSIKATNSPSKIYFLNNFFKPHSRYDLETQEKKRQKKPQIQIQ